MKTLGGRQKTARCRWVVCACALASTMVAASWARAAGESAVTVSVRVYNYAKVSRRVVGSAEREASRIFTAAGIETTWLDCLTSQAQVQSGPATAQRFTAADLGCDLPVRGAAVSLRILSSSMVPTKDFTDEMFGFATGSDLASVFYQRVIDVAW